MRVECGSCKRLVEARFQLAATGQLDVTCLTCGKTARTDLAAPAAPSTTIPLEKLCPKCGVTREPGAEACRGCGISSSRMTAFAEERDAAVPESVHDAWIDLERRWSEPAAHDDLLRLVSQHGCYAWAAAKYRTAAASRPHDPVARTQLDRLRRAGEATLFASAKARGGDGPAPYRAVIAVLGLLVIAIIAGVFYAAVKDSEAATAPPASAPAAARVAPAHVQVR